LVQIIIVWLARGYVGLVILLPLLLLLLLLVVVGYWELLARG
jgi:hypothetical protein